MISLTDLISKVSLDRGGRPLRTNESLGYDLHTAGPEGERFDSFTFPSAKMVEMAASKITWVKGGSIERSNNGKKLVLTLHRL